ncbi:hypothetical protein OsJ_27594 [Oryza sativa Japonica Group]|uniref:Uncharacterized protein n=1 Tax=Oryza sativa subsp. japonica TaxID=39947 RepID=B9G1A6_ORYSJ|nr:hypothetical protein OsJ_27594 [Oryza sativa Japonica Group]
MAFSIAGARAGVIPLPPTWDLSAPPPIHSAAWALFERSIGQWNNDYAMTTVFTRTSNDRDILVSLRLAAPPASSCVQFYTDDTGAYSMVWRHQPSLVTADGDLLVHTIHHDVDTLKLPLFEWEVDGTLQLEEEFWSLPSYQGSPLPRITPTFPVFSMHEADVLHFILDRPGYDDKCWVITVDIKNKSSLGSSNEFRDYLMISTDLSKYSLRPKM